jgi:hypothetical protein
MKRKKLKIILILFILLLLDLVKPFYYFLYIEFLFLGIIFVSLNFDIFFPLLCSLIFGYLKDCLSFASPLSIIEFPLIVIISRYFLFHFHKKTFSKVIILFISLFFHMFLNTLYWGRQNFLFYLFFSSHSFIIYFFSNNFLIRWLKN